MDAAEIRSLQPRLRKFLRQFDACFARRDTRQHLRTYVHGRLSDLPRKSVEPIAMAADVPPRTLQQFLNSLAWDQEQMIDVLQLRAARAHTSCRSVGLIDETACPKVIDYRIELARFLQSGYFRRSWTPTLGIRRARVALNWRFALRSWNRWCVR